MTSDDYLTQELPGVRWAQAFAETAILFGLHAIADRRWRDFSEELLVNYDYALSDVDMASFIGGRLPRERPEEMRLSTAAMCLHAVAHIALSQTPARDRQVRIQALCVERSLRRQLSVVCSRLKSTSSETYGQDDALTAAWFVPLLRGDSELDRVCTQNLRSAVARFIDGGKILEGGKGNTAENHAWVALLILQASFHFGRPDRTTTDYFFSWAVSELHELLSLGSSTPAKSDPAHLVCALAIALRLGFVSLPMVEEAVRLVCELQTEDGNWPIERAFVADMRGRVNRPLASELSIGACRLIDSLELRFGDSARGRQMQLRLLRALQRQREALFVSAVRMDEKDAGIVLGPAWQSEYATLGADRFHTWATARTIEALVLLRDIESRLLTLQLLNDSGFSTQHGSSLRGFATLVDSELGDSDTTQKTLRHRIARRNSDSRSVVLFGPPGTSKTSLAKAVANQLSWWLVQLSPADFLEGGADNVESRAKRIFDYLSQMEQVVVLFDEVDRLLLDRTSDAYGRLGDVFKFMTPSMLPKLEQLRSRPGIRIVIATNFGWTLDPAITRPGRIDLRLLVGPPNAPARREILQRVGSDLSPTERTQFVKRTPTWTFGEIVAYKAKQSWNQGIDHKPELKLSDYDDRFKERWRQADALAEEILNLASLILEVKKNPYDRAPDGTVLKRAWKLASGDIRKRYARVRPPAKP